MPPRPPRDQFLGAFLGLVVGDALGAPLRGLAAYQTGGPQAVSMAGGGPLGLAPGRWTRDAAQLVTLTESWLRCRGFEGEDAALRLAELPDLAEHLFDFQTQRVLDLVCEDPEAWDSAPRLVWLESGLTFCTNNALARAPLAALAHPHDVDAMVELSIRLTRLTHADPRAAEAGLAVAFLLVELLHNHFGPDLAARADGYLQSVRRTPIYQELALADEEAIKQAAPNSTPLTDWPRDREGIPAAIRRGSTVALDDLGTSDSVVHTLQVALAATMTARSFEGGLRAAVAAGGEAAAQGAVAGALLGARFGMRGIPAEWLAPLAERPRVVSLAEMLESESERLGER